jgi:hypothetical protein
MLDTQKALLDIAKAEADQPPPFNGNQAAVMWLCDRYGLKATFHPTDPLVILNYDQIDADKRHPIVRECRGLTLVLGTWDVAARAFSRFFNAGECPDLEAKFDWSDGIVGEDKEDGSLILVYKFGGRWRVNTRGSFGQGEVCPGLGKTWEQLFLSSLASPERLDKLSDSFTYVFELCSPFNKVVREYPDTQSFMLAAFLNKCGTEVSKDIVNIWAAKVGAKRPHGHWFKTLNEVRHFLDNCDESTYEGVVLRDRMGNRLKVKNKDYVLLHQLKNNGQGFAPSKLVPKVLGRDFGDVLTFKEAHGPLFDVFERLYGPYGRTMAVWEVCKGMQPQKEFALYVSRHAPATKSVLFEARKQGVDAEDVWLKSEDLLVKKFF